MRVMLERLPRQENEEQPLRIPLAGNSFLANERVEEGARRVQERLDSTTGCQHVATVAATGEAEEPAEVPQHSPRPNLERRIALEECFKRGPDRAGHRQRQDVARADVAAVGVRTRVPEPPAIEYRDAKPGFREVIGGTRADDA